MATTTKTTQKRSNSTNPPKYERPNPNKLHKRWQDVEGRMRLFGNEIVGKKGPFMTYSTSVGVRDDNDFWTNLYYNVRFRKGEDPQITGAFEIDIKMGFITLTESNDEIYPTVMVLAYELVEGE